MFRNDLWLLWCHLGIFMSHRFLRERLVGVACCLLGIMACVIMWYDAGLHQPGRQLNFFGGSKKTPFFERRYPEATITFSGLGFGAVLLGLLGFAGRRMDDQPEWWNHGVGSIVAAVVFGLLLTQARWVNGMPFEVMQPGYYLALAAVGGLAAVGVSVMVRSMWPRSR